MLFSYFDLIVIGLHCMFFKIIPLYFLQQVSLWSPSAPPFPLFLIYFVMPLLVSGHIPVTCSWLFPTAPDKLHIIIFVQCSCVLYLILSTTLWRRQHGYYAPKEEASSRAECFAQEQIIGYTRANMRSQMPPFPLFPTKLITWKLEIFLTSESSKGILIGPW